MKSFRSYRHLAVAALLTVCSLSASVSHADLETVMADHPTAAVVGAGVAGAVAGTVVGKGIVSAATWLAKDSLTLGEELNVQGFRGSLAVSTEPNKHRVAVVTSPEAIRRHGGRPDVAFFNTRAWGSVVSEQLIVEGTPLISNKYLWNSVIHQYGYMQEMIVAYPRSLGESAERMLLNSFCSSLGADRTQGALPYVAIPYAGGYKAEEIDFNNIDDKKMVFFLMSDTESRTYKAINDGMMDKLLGRKPEMAIETVPYPSVQLFFWSKSSAIAEAGDALMVAKRIDSLTCSSIAPKK